MATHSRVTPFLALVGALALGAAPTARAQDTTNAMPRDTSAAAQSDTSGYRGYQNPADTSRTGQSSTRTDSSGFKYNGPPTDTTLKAAPGAQTGPAAGDSGSAGRTSSAAGMADTVVCKDGSNMAKAKSACGKHGGVDRAATRAAMKARGRVSGYGADSAAASSDTGQMNKTDTSGYQGSATGADTALRAKPGTQTGPDTSAAGKADTGTADHYKSP